MHSVHIQCNSSYFFIFFNAFFIAFFMPLRSIKGTQVEPLQVPDCFAFSCQETWHRTSRGWWRRGTALLKLPGLCTKSRLWNALWYMFEAYWGAWGASEGLMRGLFFVLSSYCHASLSNSPPLQMPDLGHVGSIWFLLNFQPSNISKPQTHRIYHCNS